MRAAGLECRCGWGVWKTIDGGCGELAEAFTTAADTPCEECM